MQKTQWASAISETQINQLNFAQQKNQVSPAERNSYFREEISSTQNEAFSSIFAGTPVLEVSDVDFGYVRSHRVLNDVNLTVPEATITGLIGPNGSGKTTLINLISDVYDLQSGKITVLGKPSTSCAGKIGIMHVGGNNDVPTFLTGMEYIMTMGRLYGVNIRRSRVRKLFARFGMAGAENRLIDSYSHGMKKKAQLCAAFLIRCPLTIVDETLNGIDIDAWYVCVEEFKSLREDGLSVLLCTHDFTLLQQVSDDIVLLHNGHMDKPLVTTDVERLFGGIAEWYQMQTLQEAS
ncbi:ABC transporter ATP-binding protein [Bifidobacterium dolichotidis]|nr:ABC transporter ATP-binding protein [Bifidobacterium dolichotidis]